MEKYDIIIVGGGPVGLYTASLLQKDFKVLVLEKEKELGKKACSGLYSKKIFEFVPQGHFIENEIDGCTLYSPSGSKKHFEIKQKPFVVDREEFNKFLAEGLENLKIGCKVEVIEFLQDSKNSKTKTNGTNDGVKVKTNQGEFHSEIIIGADGSRSIVRQHWQAKPFEIVSGLIGMVEQDDSSRDVGVWFDKKLTEDGFLWKIPRGKRIEYGMLGLDVSYTKLEKFFGLKNYQKIAAPIPVGLQKSFFERTLLIGDAASQTKPWSLGGVLFGFLAANVAKNVLKQAFDRQDFSEKKLEGYEIGWKKEFGGAIEKGMFFREFYKELDNKKIDEVFEKVDGFGLNDVDMDNPFSVIE